MLVKVRNASKRFAGDVGVDLLASKQNLFTSCVTVIYRT